jgi:hypothetical protein
VPSHRPQVDNRASQNILENVTTCLVVALQTTGGHRSLPYDDGSDVTKMKALFVQGARLRGSFYRTVHYDWKRIGRRIQKHPDIRTARS